MKIKILQIRLVSDLGDFWQKSSDIKIKELVDLVKAAKKIIWIGIKFTICITMSMW